MPGMNFGFDLSNLTQNAMNAGRVGQIGSAPRSNFVDSGGQRASGTMSPSGVVWSNGGIGGAWDDIKQKQDWAMNKQLASIDALRNQLSTTAPKVNNAYADAANAQLARSQGALTTGAQQQQKALQDQMAARGMGRSGLAGQQVNDLERARLSALANVQNQTREAIGSRAFSDQLAYNNMLANQGNMLLGQQGSVLGNIQYTQPPQVPTNPYGDANAALRNQLGRIRSWPPQDGYGPTPSADPGAYGSLAPSGASAPLSQYAVPSNMFTIPGMPQGNAMNSSVVNPYGVAGQEAPQSTMGLFGSDPSRFIPTGYLDAVDGDTRGQGQAIYDQYTPNGGW